MPGTLLLSVIAGNGSQGAPTPGPATSSNLNYPGGVAVDGAGNVYIADEANQVVEKVAVSGALSVIAGNGSFGAPTPGPATSSDLASPFGVAVDGAGNVYIADGYNIMVEKVDVSGTLSVIAGTGSPGASTPGPATSSNLASPFGVAVDGSGNVYIADAGNIMVEKVDPSGTLSVIAGTGSAGAPTPGPATSSNLAYPYGVAVDGSGNVYIADTNNAMVEKVGFVAAPTITSVSPKIGPAGSGDRTVTIFGTGFTGATGVLFSTTPATNVVVVSDTQVRATIPAHPAGGVNVRVTTPAGTSAIVTADRYTYVAQPTVTGLSPAVGPTTGGNVVTVTGTGFTAASTVSFGSTPGTAVKRLSKTTLQVTTPGAMAGTVDVTVTTVGGSSTTVPADLYTYN